MEDPDRHEKDKQDPPSHLLVLALEKANSAVLQDSMGDMSSSLKLYRETVEMLQQVIDLTEPEEDRKRLDKIRISYLERIEFLTQKTSLDTPVTMSTFIKDLPPTPTTTKANSLFNSVFFSSSSSSSSKKTESTSNRSSFFIKMRPSTSTPVPSLSKSSSSLWKLNGKRNNNHSNNSNNRRSTDLTDFNMNDQQEEIPALPCLEKVHDDQKDLFESTKSTLAFSSTSTTIDSRKSTDTESTLSADGDVIQGTAEKFDVVINSPVMIQTEMTSIQKKQSSAMDSMNELERVLSQTEEAVADIVSEKKSNTIRLFTPSSRTSSRKSSMKKSRESISAKTATVAKSEKQSNSTGFGTLFKAHKLLPQKSFESTKSFSSNNKSAPSLQTIDTDTSPPPPVPKLLQKKDTLKKGTKSRKWSINSNNNESPLNQITKNSANIFSSNPVSKHLAKVQQASPTATNRVKSMCFLEEPSKESKTDLDQDDDSTTTAAKTFLLMDRLHKSITQGGYISARLHVPMDLWYQKSVRLPVVDAKITACELLIAHLDKMDTRHTFDNTGNVVRDLKTLGHILDQIKYSLIRKLQYIEDDKGQHTMMPQYKTYIGILSKENNTSSKTSQTIASWGSKLTKSMERINITNNPHDQMDLYIKTLIRLFTSAKVLVRWSERLQERCDQSKGETKPINENILKKHNGCVEQFGLIFCGFVLRDYTILLDKWMKRAQEWTLD